jgi:hypothetical protein
MPLPDVLLHKSMFGAAKVEGAFTIALRALATASAVAPSSVVCRHSIRVRTSGIQAANIPAIMTGA